MWTGASIMQLVAKGKLKLDEPIAALVDRQFVVMKESGLFPSMHNFSTLADLYGPEVSQVTLHDLLHMASGIPDFDTANPSRTGPDLDPFRATVYKHADHDYLEPDLLSLPWVATKKLESKPGEGFHYSSTNFGLLGLILAGQKGITDYRKLNQSYFIPESLSRMIAKDMGWAATGSPKSHGVVPGFDRTDYNGQNPKKNPAGVSVWDVNGVFAGWSAADFVGTPYAVATLGYALWGKPSTLVPEAYRQLMVPNVTSHDFRDSFYGLASQNVGLMGITGPPMKDKYHVAYGHLGATYGYDSIFAYNPALDLAIAIGTNIETATQTQPADAFCRVYNRVKNHLLKEDVQTCTYVVKGYYGGQCECQ